jgi:nucleoid-associated protein YgaU
LRKITGCYRKSIEPAWPVRRSNFGECGLAGRGAAASGISSRTNRSFQETPAVPSASGGNAAHSTADVNVNRSSKLFVAAAILAAGYGVARLVGSPAVPYLAKLAPPHSNKNGHATIATPAGSGAIKESRSIRLLPAPAPFATHEQPQPLPMPVPEVAPVAIAPIETPNAALTPTADSTPAAPAERPSGMHARFLDAPPRPLAANDPAELQTSRPRARLENQANSAAAASGDANAITSGSTTLAYPDTGVPDVTQWVLSNGVDRSTRQAATTRQSAGSQPTAAVASFDQPAWKSTLTPVAPLERIHTVVDGDSLEKLAARYLRDAKRSGEIYALNRDVLASPELLPIGAELKLPRR